MGTRKRLLAASIIALVLSASAFADEWETTLAKKYFEGGGYVVVTLDRELVIAGPAARKLSNPETGRYVFLRCGRMIFLNAKSEGQDRALLKRAQIVAPGDSGHAEMLRRYKTECWSIVSWAQYFGLR